MEASKKKSSLVRKASDCDPELAAGLPSVPLPSQNQAPPKQKGQRLCLISMGFLPCAPKRQAPISGNGRLPRPGAHATPGTIWVLWDPQRALQDRFRNAGLAWPTSPTPNPDLGLPSMRLGLRRSVDCNFRRPQKLNWNF